MLLIFLLIILGLVDEHRIDQRDELVARVSVLEGEAKVKYKGEEDWNSATGNYPLSAGDFLYVEESSRLELELYLAYVRLNEKAVLEILSLAPYKYKFSLSEGTASFTLLEDMREFEVYTPVAKVKLKGKGSYRINVLPGGDTEVISRRGSGEVFVAGDTFKLKDGRRAVVRADDPEDVEISSNLMSDYWDGWNDERDGLLSSVASVSISNTYAQGLADLYRYGTWIDSTPWGRVWAPSGVPAGWVPYRNGFWIYRRWGWTWVSLEPWGWLPYHQGRWVFFADIGRWVWVPYVDYFWYPSLVYWYFIRNNGRDYVCWRPRPLQDSGRPRVERHLGDEGTTYPGGSPRPRIDDLGNDITVLDLDDFVGGRPPGQSERPKEVILKAVESVPTISLPQVPMARPRSVLPPDAVLRPTKQEAEVTTKPRQSEGGRNRIDDKLAPVYVPTDRPAQPSNGTTVERPSMPKVKPVDRPVERPVERPTNKRPEGSVERPVDRPRYRPERLERLNKVELGSPAEDTQPTPRRRK
ncbi:MAG: hypothetical protein RMM17_01795 [Acidobacteriota bacterium]|nr:hypothetical protein [Blastocatellia bacterium]MDW8411403.1 hypothetical protein [Acidobacteriota bacterium]